MNRLALLGLLCISTAAFAETVDVKYRGPVDVSSFDCATGFTGSFVNRICYHAPTRYMVIRLRKTYYHYRDIGPETVAAFKAAASPGLFYNREIKSSANGGLYDCRGKPVPDF
jgi:hypothetical protein